MKLEQAARQALNWIDANAPRYVFEAIEEALAEPQVDWKEEALRLGGLNAKHVGELRKLAEQAEQEPVAWLWVSEHGSERLEWEPVEDTSKWKSTPLYAAPVRTKDYNPDVIFNDDGTFSLTLPDGDELRIIPPQQEPTAEVTEDGYAWGKDGILPAGSLLYAAPVRTKDLTDDEIYKLADDVDWAAGAYLGFARAVIAADREKNK